jgi:hypothetical protein
MKSSMRHRGRESGRGKRGWVLGVLGEEVAVGKWSS